MSRRGLGGLYSRFRRVVGEEGLAEALARAVWYASVRVASKLRRVEWAHLQPQEELLAKLFAEREFTLIILDACRYDYFREVYRQYLDGYLRPVRSPASCTGRWLRTVFVVFGDWLSDVKLFSAHPRINSKGIAVRGFSVRDYFRGQIIDVWDWGWDWELGTVHPDTVVKAVLDEGLGDRNIIWFMQPHLPYIGETKLLVPKEVIKGKMAGRFLTRMLRTGRISRQYLTQAYRDNLALALKAVKKLLAQVGELRGRWVVTSDHGELLGEHGVTLHPSYLDLPEQRIVPWLELKAPPT